MNGFPEWECYRVKKSMPPWRFSFSRPAGLIYGTFDATRHKIPRIAIPPEWPRFLGLDFGGVNTAGVFFAEERDAYQMPTGRLFAYREYWAGERSAAERRREFAAGGSGELGAGVPGVSDEALGGGDNPQQN